MSASDNLHNHQFRLFIPARELMGYTAGHTEGYGDSYLKMNQSPNVYTKKLRESKGSSSSSAFFAKKPGEDSLYESIKKYGVRQPINLKVLKDYIQIDDGHHRLASANDIDPNMEIPVTYGKTRYR